jgi:hypothetical protein
MKLMWMATCVIVMLLASLSAYGETHTERDYETAMTRGSFQYETGDYFNAAQSFKQALSIKPSNKDALLWLGMVYSRSGDLENARTTLSTVLKLDKTDRRALYELALVQYKMKAMDDAGRNFTQVVSSGVEDELTADARRYLDILAARRKGPFTLAVLAGLQHDSNVILEPSNPAVSGAKQADWRGIASLNAAYAFVKQERTTAEVVYSFYQSAHHNITEFNVQQHSLGADGRYSFSDAVRGGLAYRYYYAIVDRDRYSGTHQIVPTLSFTVTPNQSADLSYVYEDRTFFDTVDFPQNSDRDGTNNSVALTYRVAVSGTLGASAGLAYDKDSTTAAWWSGDGRKLFGGLAGAVAGIKASLDLSFYHKEYSAVFPGYADIRSDRVQEASLHLMKEVGKRISIDISDQYTRNSSNLGPFDYRRNITGLFAVMTL